MAAITSQAGRSDTPPARPPVPGTGRRRVARIAGYTVLLVFAVVFLYPFVIQLANSFKTEAGAANDPLSPWPHPFSTVGFLKVFWGTQFPLWLGNSVLVTLVSTAGRVAIDSLCGYALARLRFPGRRLLFGAIVAMIAVPGVVLLIPKFLVLNQLGLYNSYPGLISLLLVDAGGIFIMKQSFELVSPSIEEAARIDGAGALRTFWSVVLPTVRPALLTITILSFQGVWNDFTNSLVAVQSPNLFTLPRGVADLVTGSLGGGTQYPLKLSAALLATIPVAVIFFVFQRYFVRGTSEGGDKG